MKARAAAPPMTFISEEKPVSYDELAERIRQTHREHGDVLQAYHQVWYQAPHTWSFTHFLNIGLLKCPNDLWVYQQIIARERPQTIIETGTYLGGSSLWFAFLMDALNIDGRIYTVDCLDRRKCRHPKVEFIEGDCLDPAIAKALKPEITYPLLISLDSDHAAAHVRQELELYAPLTRVGDRITVEDTNIAWTTGGDNGDGDRGARGGLEDYLRAHPGEFRQDILSERFLCTMHPGGWLQRVRAAA